VRFYQSTAAFIAIDGKKSEYRGNATNSTHTHNAQSNILYALGMNKGWFGLLNTPSKRKTMFKNWILHRKVNNPGTFTCSETIF